MSGILVYSNKTLIAFWLYVINKILHRRGSLIIILRILYMLDGTLEYSLQDSIIINKKQS